MPIPYIKSLHIDNIYSALCKHYKINRIFKPLVATSWIDYNPQAYDVYQVVYSLTINKVIESNQKSLIHS